MDWEARWGTAEGSGEGKQWLACKNDKIFKIKNEEREREREKTQQCSHSISYKIKKKEK